MRLLLLVLLLAVCCSILHAATTFEPSTHPVTEENLCVNYGYLCRNGGTCVKEGGTYSCRCAAGYTGILCNINLSQQGVWCRKYNLCRNGATCVSYDDTSFSCTCVAGYTGVYCHINIDDCKARPCVHGTCVDRVNDYDCACQPGWQGKNCDADIDECASSPCHANATCTNSPGSYSCACNPGYYGNGTVCNEDMQLPTSNASKLAAADFLPNSLSKVTIESETPFLIGQEESLTCRISYNGFLSFSDPPYQLRYPTWPTYITKPMVYPYWSIHYSFVDAGSGVHYELLESDTHADTQNWRSVQQIISDFDATGAAFQPLSALIVTWKKMRPYSWYSYYCTQYCEYYYRVRGWTWAQWYCRYCPVDNEEVSFQVIVTRNETHSFEIINYGEFKLRLWRWRFYYAAAGFTDGHAAYSHLPFSFNWYRTDPNVTDNNRIGNTGKAGRHVLVMATAAPMSARLQCRNWIKNEKQHRSSLNTAALTCNNCPRDLRQAVLDWRYWMYDFSCERRSPSSNSYKLKACFRGPWQCAQRFAGHTCSRTWRWWCNWETCQYFSTPRCCYKININWRRDGALVDLCNAGYSTWQLRWRLRWEMFDRRRSGSRIRSTKRGAGHCMVIGRQEPLSWWIRDFPEQWRNETHGLDVCAQVRKLRRRYRSFRPKCNSRNYVRPVWGFNRGDPHISSLDGRTYSFNGQCEYHMLRNKSEDYPMLELQARLSLAESVRPGIPSRATVFSGFALRAGQHSFGIAVLLNRSSGEIDVYSNGSLIGSVANDFFGNDNATVIGNYSLAANTNTSITISESDSGFSITITKALSFLQAALQLDQDKHAGGVQGLLGNFNGNDTDDFELRNGTLLPGNSSERELFDFGQSWRLLPTDTSHFPYPAGASAADYCNLTFVPAFAEDYKDNLLALFSGNQTLLDAANATCANPSEPIFLSCMYDAAQLQTVAAAEEAVLQVRQEVAAKAVAANSPPVLHMPANITITYNTTFNITINFTDPDGHAVNLSIQEPANDTSVWLAGNTLMWQVGLINASTNLTILATDSLGAPAAWQPVLLFCHCENAGVCSFDHAAADADDPESFYTAQCNCPDGYQGDRCETEPCSATPSACYNASMCHMNPNGTYYCDPCPAGMAGDGKMCQDRDECKETPGLCQQTCTNLSPGYECSCSAAGYEVSPANSSLCVDVDECATGNHTCTPDKNQTCFNTPGSYECRCSQQGHRLNALAECQDIDECSESPSLCPGGVCINTPGSYTCECQFGLARQAGVCKAVVVDDAQQPPSTSDNVVVVVVSVLGGVVGAGAVVGIIVFLCRSSASVASV